MSAHTPGPWQWVGKADGTMTILAGNVHQWGTGSWWKGDTAVVGGCGCCGSPFGADDAGELEANARLIAAAPDLFAALVALRDEAARCIAPCDWTDLARHIEAADAALARVQP